MQLNTQRTFWALALISGLIMTIVGFVHPLYQDPNYHAFADQRNIWSIHHIGDVLSNMLFVIVGWRLWLEYEGAMHESYPGQRHIAKRFWIACVLLGAGSGYYHWNPDNNTLFWDRATMLLGFSMIFVDSMFRFGLLSSDNIKKTAWTYQAVFVMSLGFWVTMGRLEPYVFCQFFVMSVLPLLSIMNRKSNQEMFRVIVPMFVLYTIAKLFETFDHEVFSWTHQLISGHTIKHAFYALALWWYGKDMMVKHVKEKS